MVRIGSAFSGIGGFELGLERAIPNSKTVWQIEQNAFCQKILRKHWADAKIYDDVREVGAHNLEPVDIFCAGFPCQDISVAGKGEGLNGKKSGLWWECFRIISELRPRIIVLENVSAVTFRGGREVVGSLTSIGYDTEWQVISAGMFGAPHIRKRWFLVGYASHTNKQGGRSTWCAIVEDGVMLPTPTAKANQMAPDFRRHWKGLLPTPTATEHKYRLKGNSQASRCLEARARKTVTTSGEKMRLNPLFVEWMMGFPTGWTDLEL